MSGANWVYRHKLHRVENFSKAQQSSRGELYLAVASLLWLMWLFGALSQSFTRTLSVFLFDLLGAVMLLVLSHHLPSVLRFTVVGLGLALLSIGIGDGNLSAALITQTDPEVWLSWRRPFYYLGSLLVTVFTLALPFALHRQGLYSQAKPVSVVMIGLMVSGVMTSGLVLLSRTETFQVVFFFVGCLIACIFAVQNFILRHNELSKIFRQLSVVFVLVSLGRLVLIILGGSFLGEVIYDLFWCAGVSATAWTLITRE